MMSASESVQSIIDDYKAMVAHSAQESALSTNKPWVSATGGKRPKRDAPDHTPLDGETPETFASLSEQTLSGVATVIKARRVRMEQGSRTIRAPVGSVELAKRRKAALKEVNTTPIEVAFLFGYSSEKPVRELRIRHGLNEHTGAPLTDKERPVISDRRRARQ